MKRLLMSVSVLVMACGGDDPKPYHFKNQVAQGKIENATWIFGEGIVSDYGDDLSIDLLLDQANDPCNFSFEGDQVSFIVPNAVGLYKLKFNLSTWDGQVVTLFDIEETNNILASSGAIEILTITDTQVTGRLDARSDKYNYVNGNFTVTRCP